MKERSFLSIKMILVLSLFVSLLAGCGAPNIKDTYPLESVNRDGNATSYVYRAADKSVPEVAGELMAANTPDQSSPEDTERMFLVYGDEYYHLQQDPQKPTDTLIEIDSKEYVQRNYDSSFLQGYLTAVLIGNLFDSMGGGGGYRGYTSKDVYKPKQGNYKKPTSQDKKIAPPLTVDRSGKITRRGQDAVGTGGSLFKRNPTSSGDRGSIKRGESGGGLFDSPKKSYTKPKTRIGSGGISRRGRR
ncbi:DUF4247 domain-containing protein [Paenibacillus glucanolyticus]|jgi:hypothetical protein|nr:MULTISPECIES: DUF4247 domain-containing protein [Paenibacillus]ANA82244.1 hypothetical protein A3958_20720 [Paenibacillus glucanolyticus]AVV59017.1 DUF4247 domain-containing protein [Paenibacillus glucanolyticus]AWP28185.1 hypothetical protein B9D94_16885 [Paenibacillus sp. Cedars]ETT41667.1 hypothetical protein C169_05803 [Paenibacillus sp. FSL R5-808]MDH6672370.1 hypothetical protein [Paenibacillus sp. LBL]